MFFNKRVFAESAAEGVLSSVVLFFIPYAAFQDAIQANGTDISGLQSFGTVVASILILVVSLRVGDDTRVY
jgi:phospholipid-translocating ATPase